MSLLFPSPETEGNTWKLPPVWGEGIEAEIERAYRELFDLAGMKAGASRGLPHRPYVYVTGEGVKPYHVLGHKSGAWVVTS